MNSIKGQCPACSGSVVPTRVGSASLGHVAGLLLIALITLVVVLGCHFGCEYILSRPLPAGPHRPALIASVYFNGFGFEVSNQNDFGWSDVRMEVNGEWRSTASYLSAGSMKVFPSGTFAKSNGERFNAFLYKPQSFSIYCDEGYSYHTWK